jgi:hypothetical protein
MDPQVYLDRLMRLARLDTSVFEEMRDDPQGTIPAIGIGLVSFFIAGLGGWFWLLMLSFPSKARAFFESAVIGSVFATAMWVVWIAVAYLLLVNVFHYVGNLERCIRACGLAAVPAALTLFMFVPGVNFAVGLASIALVLLLMDIGIQVSFEAQPGHVIVATFAGFLVFAGVLSVAVTRTDWFAPGVFLFRILAASV